MLLVIRFLKEPPCYEATFLPHPFSIVHLNKLIFVKHNLNNILVEVIQH
jgi:hypothetical protein